jgi:uncharacterized protein YggE
MRGILVAAASALLLTGCGDSGSVGGLASAYQPYPPSVSVTGIGTATGIADMAVISFSVNVSDMDPGVAVNQATVLAEGAIQAAIDIGISEDSIETVGYSLYMEEEYDYNTYEYTGESIYRLTHSFIVKVTDIEMVGELLAALVSGGATTIGGVEFTVSNRDELIAEARNNAIQQAKVTAEQLAEGMGVSLGNPISISEWVDTYAGYNSYDYGITTSGESAYVPPISNGSSSVTMNVSVSFAIE